MKHTFLSSLLLGCSLCFCGIALTISSGQSSETTAPTKSLLLVQTATTPSAPPPSTVPLTIQKIVPRADGCTQELQQRVTTQTDQLFTDLTEFLKYGNIPPAEIALRVNMKHQQHIELLDGICTIPTKLRILAQSKIEKDHQLYTALKSSYPQCAALLATSTTTVEGEKVGVGGQTGDVVTVAESACKKYINDTRDDLGGISLKSYIDDAVLTIPMKDVMHKQTLLFDGLMANINTHFHVFSDHFSRMIADLDKIKGAIGDTVLCTPPK